MKWGRMLALAGGVLLLLWLFMPVVAVSYRRPPAGRFCRSNLKMLSAGLQMYCEDYGGYFPPVGRWDAAIDPYVKSPPSFRCGVDVEKRYPLWADRAPVVLSYAFNRNLDGGLVKGVQKPAEVVVLFESELNRPGANGTTEAVADPPRHRGLNHYAFVDGHVEWLRSPPDFGNPRRNH